MTSLLAILTSILIGSVSSAQAPTDSYDSCDIPRFHSKQSASRDRIALEVQRLIVEMKAIAKQRSELLDLQTETLAMNPIERGLKGAFDRKYSSSYFEQQQRLLDRKMDSVQLEHGFLEIERNSLDVELRQFVLECKVRTVNAPNQ